MEFHSLNFERTLAWLCAPSLAGIKPADLISYRPEAGDPTDLPVRYDRLLSPRGIRVRELCRCPRGCLLLVYRPERLERSLSAPRGRELLRAAGYPAEGDLETLLSVLAGRLGQGGPFPHEVGLFLGYPPEDVEGFCRHGGRNYKLSGPWKVYGHVEEARARFETFRRCRDTLYRHVEEGRTLAQIFPAA